MLSSSKISKINPLARAVGVVGAVMALVTGVTFAALSDTATLTGNSIGTASANANLLLWDGDSFESSAPGFNFTGLEPGEASKPFDFYLKNKGNVDLDLTAEIPALPAFSDGITAEDVTLSFSGNCDDEPVSATLAELNAAPIELPCGPLTDEPNGFWGDWRHRKHDKSNYRVTVKVADDVALGETEQTVGAFDIVFNGTADTGSEEPETPPVEETPVEETPVTAPVM